MINFFLNRWIFIVTYLYVGDKIVEYTECYKYLGVYFNEHLEFEEHCKISELGTRALETIVGKVRKCENMGYETYILNV